MTHPTSDTVEAANALNAAIVAAVAAGDSTDAFTNEHGHHLESMHHIDAMDDMEPLDTAAIETIVAAGSGSNKLKRPAEDVRDDDDAMEDSVKLRKLQEEVNNNTNAAAQASGILSSSLSARTSGHTSTSNSAHNSPGHHAHSLHSIHTTSSPLETHVPTPPATEGSPLSDASSVDVASPVVTSVVTERKKAENGSQVAHSILAAATNSISGSSYERILADVERIRELAKIDPAQLASYSTNPNNQAAIEQLTSSALANVLAQAPSVLAPLQNSIVAQQRQEQSQQQGQEQPQPQQPQQQSQQREQQQHNVTNGALGSGPTTSTTPTATIASTTVSSTTTVRPNVTVTATGTVTTSATNATAATTATSATTTATAPAAAAASATTPSATATAESVTNDYSSPEDDDNIPGKRSNNPNATNEERRQRRLYRNRVAAKECRKKKKAMVQELQETCAFLKEENARLRKEIEELNAKLTLGAMRADENVRLIKEVEELNAKLTMGVLSDTTNNSLHTVTLADKGADGGDTSTLLAVVNGEEVQQDETMVGSAEDAQQTLPQADEAAVTV
ncbi:hypothetical protein BGZ94_002130 [Podila epigama]|nr:hypothetical protein BGZ94_002130 [Podila epigama]